MHILDKYKEICQVFTTVLNIPANFTITAIEDTNLTENQVANQAIIKNLRDTATSLDFTHPMLRQSEFPGLFDFNFHLENLAEPTEQGTYALYGIEEFIELGGIVGDGRVFMLYTEPQLQQKLIKALSEIDIDVCGSDLCDQIAKRNRQLAKSC